MDFPVLAMMPDGTAREAAGAVLTASPGTVVSPRSGTCGTDCRASPCTLRDMRAAQRFLDETPGLVLWAELAVLAHLTGWLMPLPAPGRGLAAQLAGLAGLAGPGSSAPLESSAPLGNSRLGNSARLGNSGRQLDCAVSHAVDAAVACRVSVSFAQVSPAALAGQWRPPCAGGSGTEAANARSPSLSCWRPRSAGR